MKKISKAQLVRDLAIELPELKKAKEYSKLEENSHKLILSFTKVENRIMQRYHCRGYEVLRCWNDVEVYKEHFLMIGKHIKNNLGGGYYFREDMHETQTKKTTMHEATHMLNQLKNRQLQLMSLPDDVEEIITIYVEENIKDLKDIYKQIYPVLSPSQVMNTQTKEIGKEAYEGLVKGIKEELNYELSVYGKEVSE